MEYNIDGVTWYGGEDERDKDFCGKGCRWRIDGDALIIEGNGTVKWASGTYVFNYTIWHRMGNSLKNVGDSEPETPSGKRGLSYKRLVIGEGIEAIDECAFAKQPIEEAKLPSSLREIAGRAFYECDKLRRVELPSGLREIAGCVFGNCGTLEEVIIPDTVEKIWPEAFEDCKELKSIVIPKRVTYVGTNAFVGCESLKSVVLPEALMDIGYEAFKRCKSLKKIELTGSVSEIKARTFYDCASLKEIVIPRSVTEIEGLAFYGCRSLKKVMFGGTKEEWERVVIKDMNQELIDAEIEFESV